jgi:pyrroline-5-carboxylate reductase
MKKITVIGAGNMGGALIEGFLKSGKLTARHIAVADASEASRKRFEALGATGFADNRKAVEGADIVILAVKPWLIDAVTEEIAGALSPNAIVVSVAGGVPLETLKSRLGKTACFRAIPNIAAALGASMTFAAHDPSDASRAREVTELVALVGEAAVIPEKQLDAAMITGSCGTAYALRYLRAAMEASLEMGLSAELSRRVAAQTIKGAAELILHSTTHPEQLVDQVTTPGGSTIVGLNALELNGFSGAVIEGHLAVWRRMKKICHKI